MSAQVFPGRIDTAETAACRAEPLRASARSGAELLATALCDAGVEIVFGYPGGANLELFDALRAQGMRCVRTGVHPDIPHRQDVVSEPPLPDMPAKLPGNSTAG